MADMDTNISRLFGHSVDFVDADKVALAALCKHPRYGNLLKAASKTWSTGVRPCRGQYGVNAEASLGVFTLTAESACIIGAALVGTPSSATHASSVETMYELRSGEVQAIILGMDCPGDGRRARALTEAVVVTNLEAFEFGLAISTALGLPFTYSSHLPPTTTHISTEET